MWKTEPMGSTMGDCFTREKLYPTADAAVPQRDAGARCGLGVSAGAASRRSGFALPATTRSSPPDVDMLLR